jgi:hypothetical protein
MMGFVDDHHVRQFRNTTETLREFTLSPQIRVAEYRQIAKIRVATYPANMREVLAEMRLPNSFLRSLRRKEHNSLSFVQDEALDQHQTDKGFAEADAVTKKRA